MFCLKKDILEERGVYEMKNFALAGPGLSGTHLMLRCLEKVGMQRILIGVHPHSRIVPKNSPCNVLFVYADPRDILLCAVNRSLNRSRLIKQSKLQPSTLPL